MLCMAGGLISYGPFDSEANPSDRCNRGVLLSILYIYYIYSLIICILFSYLLFDDNLQ